MVSCVHVVIITINQAGCSETLVKISAVLKPRGFNMDVNGVGRMSFIIPSMKIIHYSTILFSHQRRKYWVLYLTKTLPSSHKWVSTDNGNKWFETSRWNALICLFENHDQIRIRCEENNIGKQNRGGKHSFPATSQFMVISLVISLVINFLEKSWKLNVNYCRWKRVIQ